MKMTGTKKRKLPRQIAAKRYDPVFHALGRRPTREEISESPLLYDEKQFWPWACKQYGMTFMAWVRKRWITASDREIQVMHRAWIAAGGAAGRTRAIPTNELLEACKAAQWLIDAFEHYGAAPSLTCWNVDDQTRKQQAISKLRNAIAKAEGKTR
ncbi:MAG: hypothetical protein HY360_18740 [Verrucomicrobia bacterium]|nr:hypothetical protein [Verrucomicrobiota bacterium]